MKITYEGEHAYFNNLKFKRDNKTGYYLSSKAIKNGKRIRLHRYVWEYFNGEIAEGYHVHHKDDDKSKNDIEELICIPSLKHRSHHGKKNMEDDIRFAKFHGKGIEAAKKWHKSKEGHEWHKDQYEKYKDKLCKRRPRACDNCGKEFMAMARPNDRFCSNACKSAFRRKSGVDNEKRVCKYCGNEFTTNKYAKTVYCGLNCSKGAMWDVRRLQHGGKKVP